MSESIDDKVVSMQFDNQAFERNIATTLASLGKLQKSLDFAGATRNMNDLDAAGKRINLAPIGSAVEGISAKFLAMSTIAITALSSITTKAIEVGSRVAGAFTFKPVVDGFTEYETNMNSIQTILANTSSKGSKLSDVNSALEALNHYSDQTIYNFSQMARNVGTFTAAGVDLDASVSAIKGIANLAAISGSSSEQASTAMYQLSQALAAGKVSLMDWNSVVNAGMGGEIFKKALFETGKAMKTITDVPVGASFEEWEKKGGTFREQMQKGWITADVLSTTLGAFSGSLSKASLISMGFTEAQANEMERLGKLGIAAATEVKTLSQLMGTLKEAAGSGWAKSFSIVFGEFDEAKGLFTGLSNSVGGFIKKMSDARNHLLQGWKDLGGRGELIETLGKAFGVVGTVLDRLGKAFRDVFPPMTAQRLVDLTKGLGDFFKAITFSREGADKLRRVFAGFFATVEIGWTIFKTVVGGIVKIIGSFSGAAAKLLDSTASLGDSLVALNKRLVEGGGIKDFFEKLGSLIGPVIVKIKEIISTIGDFFSKISDNFGLNNLESSLGRVEDRFGSLGGAAARLSGFWDGLGRAFDAVTNVLDKVWEHISKFFSELGDKLAKTFEAGDFNAAVDIINVGLLGTIVVMLKKFLAGDLLEKFGGGLVQQIKDVLGGVTGQLQAMQTNLQADTLMKIAKAIALLAVSIAVLSLIDSEAISKALTAMALGFAELVTTMVVLKTLNSSGRGAATLATLVAAMIGMAGAMAILTGAIALLSLIDPAKLAAGIAGMSAALAAMVTALNYLPKNPFLLAAAAGMIAIATAMTVLAGAVLLFGLMPWDTMKQGLIGIAAGLAIIVVAMNLMPVASTIAAGLAMIPLATGLTILAGAVLLFGNMSWEQMGKGLLGLAGALVVIGVAMGLMPLTMPIMAASLLVLSVALTVIAGAIAILGNLKMGELAKGIGALAAILAVLAISVNLMSGALLGAAALVVITAAVVVLSEVLLNLSKIGLKELAIAIGAIAAVLAVLGGAALLLAPAIGPMVALGLALVAIGAGFALFGAGAFLVASAIEKMAKAGVAGIKAVIESIKLFLTAIPEFAGALVISLLGFVNELLKAAPLLVKAIGVVLGMILDVVIDIVPKIAEALSVLIDASITLIREKAPALMALGFELLINLLRGIRDNIEEITTLAIEIITKFAGVLTANAQLLVDAAVNLISSFIMAISNRMVEIVGLGTEIIMQFLLGLTNNIVRVIETAVSIVIAIVDTLVREAIRLAAAGAEAIIQFTRGIAENAYRVVNAGVDLVLDFLEAIGHQAIKFARGAADLVISFLNGLADVIRQKSGELRAAGVNIASAIIEGMTGGLSSKARDVANSAIDVARRAVDAVTGWLGINSPSKKFIEIGKSMGEGTAYALDRDNAPARSAVAQAERIVRAFQDTLSEASTSLGRMDELSPVISPVLDLTQVRLASRDIDGLLTAPALTPDVSYRQARLIARTAELGQREETPTPVVQTTEVKFEQNNYSPTALSVGDIYRNTKSQIALAKEELKLS